MDRYLDLLSEKFSTTEEVITEIINLEAILQLPKGTELFLSDIHGEFPSFDHILRIGSGNLKEKVKDLFGSQLTDQEINQLTIFVAYPEFTLTTSWYEEQDKSLLIQQLIDLLRFTSVKYTRSKVRKGLPAEYSYIIEELLYIDDRINGKKDYVKKILDQLILMKEEEKFLTKLAYAIQKTVIDHLHVVGDIFDRGTQAAKVMDRLIEFSSVDIQWGNHDILWIGAYCGSEACLLTLLRIAARYNYLFELEKEYGLNLRPLFSFAYQNYDENPFFTPKNSDGLTQREREELEKIHQALAILQFKSEEQLLDRRPEFEMADRQLFDQIDYDQLTIELDGEVYPLQGACFQTIQPDDPSQLTEEERKVIDSLMYSFQHSPRMQKHIEFLLDKGSMYLKNNQHVLFHGCIPVSPQGEFLSFSLDQAYSGKSLLEFFEDQIRESAKDLSAKEDLATDLIWYAWSGPFSPLFGKSKMATFERYFLADKETHVERSNPYYKLRNEEWFSKKVLEEFGSNELGSAIINGHTPVKVKKGESPIKANGTVFVIDGGLSKAYQKTTGIAGYSLLCNSYGFQIVTHYPFLAIEQQFERKSDQAYVKKVIDQQLPRKLNRDTTKGAELQQQIDQLKRLLAYNGIQ
ncbi:MULTISPECIES: fructose-1,6-bisphosphatase [unclassified Enterococcus]|uniref:fructose-1,6-bisphosphatase n=1 Tax=unclassified Enterococcus TaxID=2608891 RepID=UPI0013EB7DF9|nr:MULTISPECIES: fructose-1,6-bisphosphatase [unclassified Enterococcus]